MHEAPLIIRDRHFASVSSAYGVSGRKRVMHSVLNTNTGTPDGGGESHARLQIGLASGVLRVIRRVADMAPCGEMHFREKHMGVRRSGRVLVSKLTHD
jgi:hypothetical protein